MSFLDILDQYEQAPESNFIKFLQQYKFQGKTLHFFFEGPDDQSFYVNFIQQIFPVEYRFFYYLCHGKEQVFTNHQEIDWTKYNKSRVLFFTDKDVDDLAAKQYPKDSNIFETKYYSMENYLVNEDILERFLREICKLDQEDLIDRLKEQFNRQLEVFAHLILSISAWIVYHRKHQHKMNLGNVDLSNLFTINNDFEISKKIDPKYNSTLHYLEQITKLQSPQPIWKEITQIARKLNDLDNHKKFVRGKFEIWFLYAFCRKVIHHFIPELNKKIKIQNQQGIPKQEIYKIHIELKEQNILEITAPRLVVPEDLKQFLLDHAKNL